MASEQKGLIIQNERSKISAFLSDLAKNFEGSDQIDNNTRAVVMNALTSAAGHVAKGEY